MYGVAEPAALVNDKVNGFAVVDKLVCPCIHGSQEGKSNKCFRPLHVIEKLRNRERQAFVIYRFQGVK